MIGMDFETKTLATVPLSTGSLYQALQAYSVGSLHALTLGWEAGGALIGHVLSAIVFCDEVLDEKEFAKAVGRLRTWLREQLGDEPEAVRLALQPILMAQRLLPVRTNPIRLMREMEGLVSAGKML